MISPAAPWSTLRAGLGAERLLSDRNSIALALDGAWFDLVESRVVAADPTAEIDALRVACELHRDDLMAGFALRDSVHFDDWLRDTQDEVRRERAGLLDRLIDALAGRGRADDAVARACERLALDELHEPTHRRLIELYALAGRRGDALGQYRDCVRVLDRELGVAPLNETTELYNSISTGTPPLPLAIEEETPPTGELALTGRDAELHRILDAFGCVGERGVLAVIEGESGVGKTRLAQEALVRLAQGGARVIVARPHAGEQGLAYGVIATVLRAAIDDGADAVPEALRGDIARLLPDFGAPPPTSLDEPGARLRFLEAISGLIAASFAAAAGVVFIDDLQWCDPASLEALAYLARRLDHRHLLLLCARRSDEPDHERRYVQLAELAERITLARLTREDVVALATRLGLDAGTAERVFRESEGLPLFVTELMSADGAAATTTGGVRAMLDARVEAASDISAQVLSAAAIIGRTFDADDVRVVSGRSQEEVASALEELIARGLIVELEHGYDFSHERLRGVVEDRLGRARRRLLHGRAAQALTARHEDHAIMARHLELAGAEQEAAIEYAAAGDNARGLSARAEAVAHYEAALALGHPDPAGLRESIGDVHTLRGEYDLALAAYNAAAAQAKQDGAGRLEHKLGAVHERRGDWQLAEIHHLQALALGGDPAVVQADRSRIAWRRGDAEEARTLGFEALGLAQKAGAQAAEAQANNLLGLLGCGREYLQRSLELSHGLADASVRIAALNNLALDHAAAGELAEAEALTREALELCTAQGDRHHEAALRNNLADVLHRAGRQDGAMEELKRAVTAFAAIGSERDSLYPGVWGLVEW